MLSRLLPKFTETMTPRMLVDALNNIVEALRGLTGFNTPAAPLGQMPDGTLYLDDTQYKRIPARLTAAKGVAIGDQPAQLRYAFIQQIFNPTTGVYSDFTSGLIGDGALTYATELNNQNLGPLTATIPATAGTGPLVWLRSKGIINGNKVYEFDISLGDREWVKVTSSSATTIYLGRTITDGILVGDVLQSPAQASFTSNDVGATVIGTGIPANTTISEVLDGTTVIISNAATPGTGVTVQIVTGTTTGYAAVIDSWSNKTGVWFDGTVPVWFIGVNGEMGLANQRYQCRYLGVDDMNVQIWAASLAVPYFVPTAFSGSLTASWSNVGQPVTLPAGTTWLLQAQLTATLTASVSGAFDYVSARYYDGTTVYGIPADFCWAPCDALSVPGTAPLTIVITVGMSDITVYVQAMINTSSGSTATLSSFLTAIQLA